MRMSDWSSDVCSSDLELLRQQLVAGVPRLLVMRPGDDRQLVDFQPGAELADARRHLRCGADQGGASQFGDAGGLGVGVVLAQRMLRRVERQVDAAVAVQLPMGARAVVVLRLLPNGKGAWRERGGQDV